MSSIDRYANINVNFDKIVDWFIPAMRAASQIFPGSLREPQVKWDGGTQTIYVVSSEEDDDPSIYYFWIGQYPNQIHGFRIRMNNGDLNNNNFIGEMSDELANVLEEDNLKNNEMYRSYSHVELETDEYDDDENQAENEDEI